MVISILAFFILLASPFIEHSADSRPGPDDKSTRVQAALFVYDVLPDPSKPSYYDVKAKLTLTWNDPRLKREYKGLRKFASDEIWTPSYEFSDAYRATSLGEGSLFSDESGDVVLVQPYLLKIHKKPLMIKIRSSLPEEEVRFVISESQTGFSEGLKVNGFEVSAVKSGVGSTYFQDQKRALPEAWFSIALKNGKLYGFYQELSIVLPALFLCFLSFWLPSGKSFVRFFLAIAALLSLLFLKMEVEPFTWLAAVAFVLLAIAESVAAERFGQKGRFSLVKALDRLFRVIFALVIFGFFYYILVLHG